MNPIRWRARKGLVTMPKQVIQSLRGLLMASIASCILVFSAMLVMTTPAQADMGYELQALNAKKMDCVEYGFYGVPGEKATYKLKLTGFDGNDGWGTVVNAKFTYKGNAKLKGSVKGNRLVFKKLPKAGTYKFKITAAQADGRLPETMSFKMIVKKKPAVKVKVTEPGKSKALKTVKNNEDVFINLGGASFGWDNNTKKPFYVLKVKNLNTGKVAKWSSKKGTYKKNGFIEGEMIAGGTNPVLYGSFTKTGKYKVSVAVYHSNKKIVAKTKTITVQ